MKLFRILRAAFDMYRLLKDFDRCCGYEDDHDGVIVNDELFVKSIKLARAICKYIEEA